MLNGFLSAVFVLSLLLSLIVFPIMLILFIVMLIKNKPSWKVFGIITLLLVVVPVVSFIGAVVTSCDHEYEITSEIAPTCLKDGEIHRSCKKCGEEDVAYTDKLSHAWLEESNKKATCTEMGQIVQKCTACGEIRKTDIYLIEHSWQEISKVDATCTQKGLIISNCTMCGETKENETDLIEHSMVVVSRVSPTYENEGKLFKKCERCSFEEVENIAQLEEIKIEFDGLELTFGQYSFTRIDSKYSEYYNKPIVKIPVHVKNVSNSPNTLNLFSYDLFGSTGIESPYVYYYFDDDVSNVGELLPDKSYDKYFHILYDGDGIYTIKFDWLFSDETVEIYVEK